MGDTLFLRVRGDSGGPVTGKSWRQQQHTTTGGNLQGDHDLGGVSFFRWKSLNALPTTFLMVMLSRWLDPCKKNCRISHIPPDNGQVQESKKDVSIPILLSIVFDFFLEETLYVRGYPDIIYSCSENSTTVNECSLEYHPCVTSLYWLSKFWSHQWPLFTWQWTWQQQH